MLRPIARICALVIPPLLVIEAKNLKTDLEMRALNIKNVSESMNADGTKNNVVGIFGCSSDGILAAKLNQCSPIYFIEATPTVSDSKKLAAILSVPLAYAHKSSPIPIRSITVIYTKDHTPLSKSFAKYTLTSDAMLTMIDGDPAADIIVENGCSRVTPNGFNKLTFLNIPIENQSHSVTSQVQRLFAEYCLF